MRSDLTLIKGLLSVTPTRARPCPPRHALSNTTRTFRPGRFLSGCALPKRALNGATVVFVPIFRNFVFP